MNLKIVLESQGETTFVGVLTVLLLTMIVLLLLMMKVVNKTQLRQLILYHLTVLVKL